MTIKATQLGSAAVQSAHRPAANDNHDRGSIMKTHPSPVLKYATRKRRVERTIPTGQSISSAVSNKADVTASQRATIFEPPRLSLSTELRPTRFGYFQPDATEVFVVGSFNGWNARATPLK